MYGRNVAYLSSLFHTDFKGISSFLHRGPFWHIRIHHLVFEVEEGKHKGYFPFDVTSELFNPTKF